MSSPSSDLQNYPSPSNNDSIDYTSVKNSASSQVISDQMIPNTPQSSTSLIQSTATKSNLHRKDKIEIVSFSESEQRNLTAFFDCFSSESFSNIYIFENRFWKMKLGFFLSLLSAKCVCHEEEMGGPSLLLSSLGADNKIKYKYIFSNKNI